MRDQSTEKVTYTRELFPTHSSTPLSHATPRSLNTFRSIPPRTPFRLIRLVNPDFIRPRLANGLFHPGSISPSGHSTLALQNFSDVPIYTFTTLFAKTFRAEKGSERRAVLNSPDMLYPRLRAPRVRHLLRTLFHHPEILFSTGFARERDHGGVYGDIPAYVVLKVMNQCWRNDNIGRCL